MKSIVTGALVAFIVLAVAFVTRDVTTSRTSAPASLPAVMLEPASPAPAAAPAVPAAINETDTSRSAVVETPKADVTSTRSADVQRAFAPRKMAAIDAKVAAPAHKIVAMYFHGDVRCATCRKVEAYAKEAVETGFAEQLAAGLVEFRPVNVEREENRHFIQDYQLTNKSVVVADEVDGNVKRWVKLDNVWALVGNHDAYLVYVQDAVRAYVEN
jgi:hypothetical protein